MQWTRKHQIYALVVGGAFTLLAIDRLWLAPSKASAGAPEASSAAATPAEATAPAGATDPVPARPLSTPVDALRAQLAGELDRLALDAQVDPDAVRNALAPGSGWPTPPEPAPDGAGDGQTEPESPQPELRLSTVLAGGQHQAAVINGEIVRLGQSIAGYRLESIRERTVRLSNGERSIVLELESPPSAR
jgi:hypothetical protein